MRADLEPTILYRLGEAIFAYIDEISGESIAGYAAEQSEAAGERQRRSARLVFLLAADPPAVPEDIRAAAVRAGWRPPAQIAALVVEGIDSERLASRLGPGAVAAPLELPGGGAVDSRVARVLAFVPVPAGDRRRAQLAAAVDGLPAALGPAVALAGCPRSAARARRALDLRVLGLLPGEGLVDSEENSAALVLHADSVLAGELADARLAPLLELRPAVRERLTDEPARVAGLPGPRRRHRASARHPSADRALPAQPAARGIRRRARRSGGAVRAGARAAGARERRLVGRPGTLGLGRDVPGRPTRDPSGWTIRH